MSQEKVLWTGRPSHLINSGVYTACILFCWLIIPACYGLWRWLQLRSIEYTLTTERLKVRTGVLNRETDTLELYRVRDFRVHEPLYLRALSLADIILATDDLSDPVLVLRAIPDASNLSDVIRERVEIMRIGRVRDIDRH